MMLYVGLPPFFAVPVNSSASGSQGWSLTGADSARSTEFLLPFASSAVL